MSHPKPGSVTAPVQLTCSLGARRQLHLHVLVGGARVQEGRKATRKEEGRKEEGSAGDFNRLHGTEERRGEEEVDQTQSGTCLLQ